MKATLRQLEIFLSVARTGSVSRSAEDLFLSQSAVSMSLAELERILGGDLFDRPGKKLYLNDRGQLFLPRAMEICDRFKEASLLLGASDKKTMSGRLRISASSTIGNYVIPKIMAAFAEERPGVSLELEVKNSRAVMQSIRNFEADAGFIEGLIEGREGRGDFGDLHTTVWTRDSLVVFSAADHPLANLRTKKHRKKAVTPADLEKSSWVMRERGSGTREILEKALGDILDKTRILLELGNTEAVKSAVASSRAISCLSLMTLADDLARGRFAVIPTPFLNLERNLYLVLHRDKYKTALLNSFLDFAGERVRN